MNLKINIHSIKEDRALAIKDYVRIEPEALGLTEDESGFCWPQPLECRYTVTNADDLYLLSGHLQAKCTGPCSRCLDPVVLALEIDFMEKFSRRPVKADDILSIAGDEIDLTGVLREQVLLSLPVKPLCSPDCRGLCPHCGNNRNQSTCNCCPREVDPRLAVLEKLINK